MDLLHRIPCLIESETPVPRRAVKNWVGLTFSVSAFLASPVTLVLAVLDGWIANHGSVHRRRSTKVGLLHS
jgi:hypothetical protein